MAGKNDHIQKLNQSTWDWVFGEKSLHVIVFAQLRTVRGHFWTVNSGTIYLLSAKSGWITYTLLISPDSRAGLDHSIWESSCFPQPFPSPVAVIQQRRTPGWFCSTSTLILHNEYENLKIHEAAGPLFAKTHCNFLESGVQQCFRLITPTSLQVFWDSLHLHLVFTVSPVIQVTGTKFICRLMELHYKCHRYSKYPFSK